MKYIASLLVLFCLVTGAALVAHSQVNQENTDMLKCVVHINFGDADRQKHGLENVRNILKEEPASMVEVVCHGEGIRLVLKGDEAHAQGVKELSEKGVVFVACQNTMQKKSIREEELLAGVTVVPSGAVEVIRKQQMGFGYFRP